MSTWSPLRFDADSATDSVDDLTEFGGSHPRGPTSGGHLPALFDHLFWVMSRGLLIALIAAMTLVLGIPFQHLISRDVISEWEKGQRSQISRQLETLDSLSVAAANFQNLFLDTTRLASEYARSLRADVMTRARAKLRLTSSALEILRGHFAGRKVILPRKIEDDVVGLLSAGDHALRLLEESIATPVQMKKMSFDAHEALIRGYVSDILEYQRTYIKSAGRISSASTHGDLRDQF